MRCRLPSWNALMEHVKWSKFRLCEQNNMKADYNFIVRNSLRNK